MDIERSKALRAVEKKKREYHFTRLILIYAAE